MTPAHIWKQKWYVLVLHQVYFTKTIVGLLKKVTAQYVIHPVLALFYESFFLQFDLNMTPIFCSSAFSTNRPYYLFQQFIIQIAKIPLAELFLLQLLVHCFTWTAASKWSDTLICIFLQGASGIKLARKISITVFLSFFVQALLMIL